MYLARSDADVINVELDPDALSPEMKAGAIPLHVFTTLVHGTYMTLELGDHSSPLATLPS